MRTINEDAPVLEMEVSDERFIEWMRGNLDRAAKHFALTVTGRLVFRVAAAQHRAKRGSRCLFHRTHPSSYPQS